MLFAAALVPERIAHEDDVRLHEWGYGITNIVARPTAAINELRPAEYRAGAALLLRKVEEYRPRVLALVGVTVWRALLDATDVPDARRRAITLGFQPENVNGARVCVLPNPSGRNANFSYEEMVAAFQMLQDGIAPARLRQR